MRLCPNPDCGASTETPEQRFCEQCGTPLDTTGGATTHTEEPVSNIGEQQSEDKTRQSDPSTSPVAESGSTCSECGTDVVDGQQFCEICGHPLVAESHADETDPPIDEIPDGDQALPEEEPADQTDHHSDTGTPAIEKLLSQPIPEPEAEDTEQAVADPDPPEADEPSRTEMPTGASGPPLKPPTRTEEQQRGCAISLLIVIGLVVVAAILGSNSEETTSREKAPATTQALAADQTSPTTRAPSTTRVTTTTRAATTTRVTTTTRPQATTRATTTTRPKAGTQEQAGKDTGGYAIYVFQQGDTLWGVAKILLGDGSRWREIEALNEIEDHAAIPDGMRLKIPPGQPVSATTTTTAAVRDWTTTTTTAASYTYTYAENQVLRNLCAGSSTCKRFVDDATQYSVGNPRNCSSSEIRSWIVAQKYFDSNWPTFLENECG